MKKLIIFLFAIMSFSLPLNGQDGARPDQVARITNMAVYCDFTADEAATLPVPDGASTYRAHAGRMSGSAATAWFRRLFGRPTWKRERDDT